MLVVSVGRLLGKLTAVMFCMCLRRQKVLNFQFRRISEGSEPKEIRNLGVCENSGYFILGSLQ